MATRADMLRKIVEESKLLERLDTLGDLIDKQCYRTVNCTAKVMTYRVTRTKKKWTMRVPLPEFWEALRKPAGTPKRRPKRGWQGSKGKTK